MGGKICYLNANMSQGGSLGYMSTLSSDINAQAGFCGKGSRLSQILEAVKGKSMGRRSRDNRSRGKLMHLAFTVPKPFIVSN